MFWDAFWASIIDNPVAAYAAVVATVAMILAVPAAMQNWRRNKRDRGLLSTQNASAGHVLQNGFRFEVVTLVLINTGLHTVSVTKYDLKVYEGLLRRLLRRPRFSFKGDGWKVPRSAKNFSLTLKPADGVPISVKSGEHVQLQIHAPTLWPDRRRRKVVAEVRYQPSAGPLRIEITPKDPWSYTDEQGLADQARLMPDMEAKQFNDGEWKPVGPLSSVNIKRG